MRVTKVTGVQPTALDDGVFCSCGMRMLAEVGLNLVAGQARSVPHLWWRCTVNPRHVTQSVPLPEHLAQAVLSDGACTIHNVISHGDQLPQDVAEAPRPRPREGRPPLHR